MELSKHVKVYEDILEDYSVLYNSFNKAIVAIEKKYLVNKKLCDNVPDEIVNGLMEHGFLLSDEERKHLINEKIKDDRLIVSVELSHHCNLNCPYCYQKDQGKNVSLSTEMIDRVVKYCRNAIVQKNATHMVLKVLGGEPLLTPDLFELLVNKIEIISQEQKIDLSLIIDTNGTISFERILNNRVENITLRVPLCEKQYHNQLRNQNGKDTFDLIIDNLNKAYASNKNLEIILRHNTDHVNIHFYDVFLNQLKKAAAFPLRIEVAYTVNFDNNSNNQLSYKDFISWKSNKAIQIAIDNDVPVTQAPLMNYSPCQFNSEYSIKVCADGSVLLCPADKNTFNLDSVLETNAIRKYDNDCLECDSFFLCGGVMKLPCIKEVINCPSCQNKYVAENHALIIHDFIKLYFSALKKGKGKLFLNFLGE